MPVRHTSLARVSLITDLLSATLLLMIGGPHFVSAQESKSSQETAESTGEAKLIARGKYIVVEGVAGCGYCSPPSRPTIFRSGKFICTGMHSSSFLMQLCRRTYRSRMN